MSMTLEEARIELQAMKDTFEEYEPGGSRCQMALNVALSALRPVSREQVEKVRGEWRWVGEDRWNDCYECGKCGKMHPDNSLFCPACGAPMTDEAVQMVLERLEEMRNG